MRHWYDKKFDERAFIGVALMVCLMAVFWGLLIMPYTIGAEDFNDHVTFWDGIALFGLGWLGLTLTVRYNRILRAHKWYEDLPKK